VRPAARTLEPTVTSVRVLIVEDDADLARALELELTHGDYDVRIVDDGPAPLRLES
jgi:DNA-binding response OmpR family regulator